MKNFLTRDGSQYERKATFPVEEVLGILSDTVNDRRPATLAGEPVAVSSLRLVNFKLHGVTCAHCGLTAEYAALERHKKRKRDNGTYHINFYGRNKDGDEDQLTVDHIIPEGQGGPNTIENTQTLCHSCNVLKGNGKWEQNPSAKKKAAKARFSEISLLLQNYESEGLSPDDKGYFLVSDVIDKMAQRRLLWKAVTPEYIIETVIPKGGKNIELHPEDPKIRLVQEKNRIQGIAASVPPEELYLVISNRQHDYILEHGIKPTNHGYTSLLTEVRKEPKSKAIILVKAKKAHKEQGTQFFQAKSFLWLTEEVSSNYLECFKS